MTYARLSPKGDRIAFLDHPRLGDIGGSVAVIDTAGQQGDAVVRLEIVAGLSWHGDEIWFTGSRTGKGGSSTLYAVSFAGRERTVFSSPGT